MRVPAMAVFVVLMAMIAWLLPTGIWPVPGAFILVLASIFLRPRE